MTIKEEYESTYHLLLRYSDAQAPEPGTIQAHINIIKQYGYAWFGKFGLPISSATCENIRNQNQKRRPIFLFLMKGQDLELVVAELLDAKRALPYEDLMRVPEYYRNNKYRARSYFKIRDLWKVDVNVLRGFRVASSGKPAFDSIRAGMASLFIIVPVFTFSLDRLGAMKIPIR